MKRVQSWAVVVVVVFLFILPGWLWRRVGGSGTVSAAPVPTESAARERGGAAPGTKATTPAAAPSFSALIDRVHTALAPDAKEQDWGEPALWEALTALVDRMKDAAGRPELELPVEWPDVQKVSVGALPQEAEAGSLWVSGGGSVVMARYAVILAHGSVRVQHAERCLIIARGAVVIVHGVGNVVLAGRHIEVGFDGEPGPLRRARPGGPKVNGSLLISGGTVVVAHATDTVCSAPGTVHMSHAHSSTFVNCPNLDVPRPPNFPVRPGEQPEVWRSVQAPDLGPLAPRERPNPLAGKVKVTQVVDGDDARGFAVVQEGGVERVVRPGAPLVLGGAGAAPAAGEQSWKLVTVGQRFALFSDGKEDAAFLLSER
jgi:hypothetical protein